MADENENNAELRDALNKAGEEAGLEDDTKESEDHQNGDDSDSEEDSKSDDNKDDKKSKKSKADEDDADDEDDDDEDDSAEKEETKRALAFYRGLTNPDSAERFLNSIAKKAGYELKSLTVAQQTAVADEIEATLKEELGDDFSLVPNNFSKALGKIINKIVGKNQEELNELRTKVTKSEEIYNRQQVDAALIWATQEYPSFEVNNKKILKEMQAFPAPEGMNHREYIKKICKLVGVQPKTSVNEERNNRNKNNKDGQKPSGGVSKERSTKPVNSLREALDLAYEEQFKE